MQARGCAHPHLLLADLMRQPSARVREAVIAVLLAHPAYAQAIPAALAQLSASEQLALRFLYSASVLLQRQYADALRPYVAERWQWLPDLFSQELGVAMQGTPRERLEPGWASCIVHTPDPRSTGPARMTMWRASSCGAGVWSTDGTSNP